MSVDDDLKTAVNLLIGLAGCTYGDGTFCYCPPDLMPADYHDKICKDVNKFLKEQGI